MGERAMSIPQPALTSSDTLERKWSQAVVDLGYLALPLVMIRYQHRIMLGTGKRKLDALNFNIIVQLLSYWWQPESVARPAKTTIAEAIGRDVRTVQRRIKQMQSAPMGITPLIKCVKRKSGPYIYLFDGLIEQLVPLAGEMARDNAAKQVVKAQRAQVRHDKAKAKPRPVSSNVLDFSTKRQ
jgi:hypothetical protein